MSTSRREALETALKALVEAADGVVEAWDTSYLAAAVRELDKVVDEAKEVLG